MNILIVDDSATEAALLKHLFESEKDMHVVGIAKNGRDAIKLTESLKPDLITMDILMPIMDGFEATSAIMSQHPTPIVVISAGVRDESMNVTFKALDAGALSVIEKPVQMDVPGVVNNYRHIIDTVRSMAEIKVIKRRFFSRSAKPVTFPQAVPKRDFEIIAIGTSVGGPQALKLILSGLPPDTPVPIVIVQHMTPGFMEGFAKWLDINTALSVKLAVHNEWLQPGTIYFAPDNYHFEVVRDKKSHALLARLTSAPPVSGFRPSATVLLKSVADTCGRKAVGILLTGMGNDGAHGLLALKEAHGHTLIQDEESAVVFGMAGVAQSIGAVDRVIKLENMADYLKKIVERNNGK